MCLLLACLPGPDFISFAFRSLFIFGLMSPHVSECIYGTWWPAPPSHNTQKLKSGGKSKAH